VLSECEVDASRPRHHVLVDFFSFLISVGRLGKSMKF
jgi:hypothetical protein